jgi:hypothetical protein
VNRGLLLWLGLALVLGALSAALVRLVVHGSARPAPPHRVHVAGPAPLPAPMPSGGARTDALHPSLVALEAAELDRREARLARRLRMFAKAEPERADAAEARGGPPDPSLETDAGSSVDFVDAGALFIDAGAPVVDAGTSAPAAIAAATPAPSARVRVLLADENDAWLKLVSVDVDVDHVRLVSRAAPEGLTLDEASLAFDGALFSGSHFVEATFVYRGAGGVFGYLDGYALRATGREAIVVQPGATTTLRVRSVDRGAIYELEQRPQVLITIE